MKMKYYGWLSEVLEVMRGKICKISIFRLLEVEPRREKTGFLHMRKQSRKSDSQ